MMIKSLVHSSKFTCPHRENRLVLHEGAEDGDTAVLDAPPEQTPPVVVAEPAIDTDSSDEGEQINFNTTGEIADGVAASAHTTVTTSVTHLPALHRPEERVQIENKIAPGFCTPGVVPTITINGIEIPVNEPPSSDSSPTGMQPSVSDEIPWADVLNAQTKYANELDAVLAQAGSGADRQAIMSKRWHEQGGHATDTPSLLSPGRTQRDGQGNRIAPPPSQYEIHTEPLQSTEELIEQLRRRLADEGKQLIIGQVQSDECPVASVSTPEGVQDTDPGFPTPHEALGIVLRSSKEHAERVEPSQAEGVIEDTWQALEQLGVERAGHSKA
jgi:hypothetical protein